MYYQLRTRSGATGPGHGELPGSLRPIYSPTPCHHHQICGAHPYPCFDTRRKQPCRCRAPSWKQSRRRRASSGSGDLSPSFSSRGRPDHHNDCTSRRQPCTNARAIQSRPVNHDSRVSHGQRPLLRCCRPRQSDQRWPAPASNWCHGSWLHYHHASLNLARCATDALRNLGHQRRSRSWYSRGQRGWRNCSPCSHPGCGSRCCWRGRCLWHRHTYRITNRNYNTFPGCGRKGLSQWGLFVRGARSCWSRCLRISVSLYIMMMTIGN